MGLLIMAKEKNNTLADSLKVVLANTFAFYLKAHNYHWNVEGENFNDYHAFFATLYNEAWAATDLIAEHIRTLDEYVPGSFGRFYQLSTISDETNIPTAINMARKLEEDNKKVLESLNTAHDLSEKANKIGITNFLEERIDIHEKHGWMLRAISKGRG
jgi:starvation-inducible DNA-binding protein